MMGSDVTMGFGGGFMWIFWILLIVFIIWGIKAFNINTSNNDNTGKESPLEILKKRFARGEIDDQEFNSKRKELEK